MLDFIRINIRNRAIKHPESRMAAEQHDKQPMVTQRSIASLFIVATPIPTCSNAHHFLYPTGVLVWLNRSPQSSTERERLAFDILLN